MEKTNNLLWIFLHITKTGGTTFRGHAIKNFSKGSVLTVDQDITIREKIESITENQRYNIKFISSHGDIDFNIHSLFSNREARYIIILRDPAERLASLYNLRMSDIPKDKIESFEEWYNSRYKNEMTRDILDFMEKTHYNKIRRRIFLFLNKVLPNKAKYLIKRIIKESQDNVSKEDIKHVKDLLEKCYFVGITKELNKDLPKLFKEMGLPKKWKNFFVTGDNDSYDKELLVKIPKKLYTITPRMREKIYSENEVDVKIYNYSKKLNESNFA